MQRRGFLAAIFGGLVALAWPGKATGRAKHGLPIFYGDVRDAFRHRANVREGASAKQSPEFYPGTIPRIPRAVKG